MTDKRSFFGNLTLFSGDIDQLLAKIEVTSSNKNEVQLVVTPNAEQVVLAKKSVEFAKILGAADFAIPDSIGVVLASRLLSLVRKTDAVAKRIPGVDVVAKLLVQASEKKRTAIVIGGRSYNNLSYAGWSIRVATDESIVSKAADSHTLWWLPAYADVEHPTKSEEKVVTKVIGTLKPDYVFVAFGAPMQEKWLVTHKELLTSAQVRVGMAVGGAFDMLLGLVPRAPKLLQLVGLEWLFRLVMQPWRWKRQLQLLSFIKLVARELVIP